MDAEMVSSPTRTVTVPIEVHVFEHDGHHYAFDVRNFSILKLNAPSATVLSRMRDLPLDALVEDLAPEIPAQLVRTYYVNFLELIQDGTLSAEPLSRPDRPPFTRLVLLLAGGCNMGCLYCFEKEVPVYQKLNLMTEEQANEILDWFFRHHEGKKAHVQLYGGEPLMNWSILQYVVERMEAWAQADEIELTKYLITNGTLLSVERIEWLRSHDVAVQVSVDGDAETHNRFRVFKSGEPTMDRITPNIEELSRQGADFNLRAVLTRQETNPNVVMDALRALGAEKVSFEVVSTDYRDAQLTDADWEDFHAEYRGFVRSPYTAWSELPSEMSSMIIRLCERRRLCYGCGAGVSEVTVAPDGSIYECQRMFGDPCGDVRDDRSPAEFDRQFLTPVDERPICKDCWARYLCGGGCMHQSYLGRTDGDPLPQFCVMKRDLAEASIVKIDEIRSLNQVAGNRRDDHLEGACTTEP